MDELASKKKDDLFRRIQDRRDARPTAQSNTTAKDNDHITQEIDTMIKMFTSRLDDVGGSGLEPSKDFLAVTEVLDTLNKEMQDLEQHFKEKTVNMPRYDVERTQKAISEVRLQYLTLQDRLQPKKKFGFKNRTSKPAPKPQPQTENAEATAQKVEDKVSNVSASSCSSSYRVTNPDKLLVIEVPAADIFGRDVSLDDLSGCTVRMLGVPSTVHMTNLSAVTLIAGPVQTSVFIENCQGCTFVLGCQQLRTHATTDSKFYLKVTSKGIIEDCKGLQFAPYTLTYPQLGQHMKVSGLSTEVNNWDKIDDFNWLYSGKQSPNWSILPQDQRQDFAL